MLITVFIMGLLLILAITFSMGKGSSFIAGYNTRSEEEQAQYDRVALTKFMGKMMFGLVFSMVCWVLSELFVMPFLFYFGLILFIAIIVFMIIYVNTGNDLRKSKE